MNSNYGKPGSRNSFDFDLGLGSNRSTPLKDQKTQTSSTTTTSSYSSYSSAQSKPSWQPKQTSWSHQPAPSQAPRTGLPNGPVSMVGDISGKSWASTPAGSSTNIGIVNKNPNLFGDLVGSVLGQGQGKSNSNVSLKNATPTPVASSGFAATNKTPYSMGNLSNSLPKTGNSMKGSGNLGSSESFGSFVSAPSNVNANKSSGLGGPSLRSAGGGGGGVGGGMGSSKDPFGSLVDFQSKQAGSLKSGSKGSKVGAEGDNGFGAFQSSSKPSTNASSGYDDGFGIFQNAPKPSAKTSSGLDDGFGLFQDAPKPSANTSSGFDDGFGIFQNASKPSTTAFPSSGFAGNNSNFMGSSAGSGSKIDDFGIPTNGFASKSQPHVQSSGADAFETLFAPSTASVGGPAVSSGAFGAQQQSSEVDDWGLDSEFGGDSSGATTELEGLPPPPAGLSAPSAKSKGMDNYKQGQFADAIKWLSWAVVLLEKAGDNAATMEVLSSRASCYKEVGEYKKAVADCTQVLDHDEKNVAALVQRALLYESMEKYRLGAEDLRTVLKIDPSNRIARSTVHRLAKMAD